MYKITLINKEKINQSINLKIYKGEFFDECIVTFFLNLILFRLLVVELII